jgi:predicted transcriptional regulator
MNSAMNSTINSQILNTVDIIKNNVSSLSTTVLNLNNNITDSIYIKFQESKREYVEDIRNIVSNNLSQNNDKINLLLQQNNSQLIDKTTLLLNDVVPKSNQEYYKYIEESISTFKKSINEDTIQILNSVNKDDSLSRFIDNFETKSTNMLQPIFTFINSSEERINKNLISLKEDNNKVSQQKIIDELSEFLGKYKNSSFKGQFGENQLETVLNQMFPSAEILNTTGIKASCDFRINRNKYPTVLIETKNYDRNVTIDEVKKFIRDIEEQKCHGVFLSQYSGITSKQNFQIDIKAKNILVYVHNVDYCPHTIQIAIDIIDSLSEKIIELDENTKEICISQDTIDEINKEYSRFIERKSSIINILKDFDKKITSEINEIKFPSLSKYLVSKCGTILNDENNIILCNICNKFEATSNRSLSAHQKGCKRKHKILQNDSNIVVDTYI